MLKTRADVEEGGKRLIELERKIVRAEERYKDAVAAAKTKRDEIVAPLNKDHQKIMEELADWYYAHPEERDPGTKQVTCSRIRISERLTTSYKYPSPLTKLIQKIKKLGFDFVRTKEEVAKDRIQAEASAEQLAAMGIKEEDVRTVFVEELGA